MFYHNNANEASIFYNKINGLANLKFNFEKTQVLKQDPRVSLIFITMKQSLISCSLWVILFRLQGKTASNDPGSGQISFFIAWLGSTGGDGARKDGWGQPVKQPGALIDRKIPAGL